jgi:TonB family protein
MTPGAQAQGRSQPLQRRALRYQVQAPLDVTVLRQGIPHTLPGRSLNLCERGIAAVLAGEVLPGEAVGLEIQLPLASSPLRARALVRHHDRLRCGMEFIGLTVEQETFLRQWVQEAKAKPEPVKTGKSAGGPGTPPGGSTSDKPANKESSPAGAVHSRGWIFLLVLAAILVGIFWWRWDRGWQEIESAVPGAERAAEQPQLQVPADVMEKLITHRVDPEYPEAARQAKLEGVVILDVVVGRDGSVVSVRPMGGPEVFTKAAEDALRWWRFEPYRVDGKPIVVETTVAVEFNP